MTEQKTVKAGSSKIKLILIILVLVIAGISGGYFY